ncbi:MAG TPA: hypothetical protein VGR24_10215 [bacterium]|nr:hypothetical protein [bacterium]
MAQTEQTGSEVRALVLIVFHDAVEVSVERLRREKFVAWVGAVKSQIHGLEGEKPRPFTGVAEIHAGDRTALNGVLEYIEGSYSHVEAYEF